MEQKMAVEKITDNLNLHPQDVSIDVLLEKYAKNNEKTIQEVRYRVAKALAAEELNREEWEEKFYQNQENGFVPGGRINSAAGMDIKATLINCFVQPVGDCIEDYDDDGYPSIYIALAEAASTMRRGGGVGYDFSHIRPLGALVKGTQSHASGPLSYMRVFDRSCETVESAGARRGAQMGVLRCDHPDIFSFIRAKDKKGEFTNFNLSVGVTDAFMHAVETNSSWELIHKVAPTEKYRKENNSFFDSNRNVWVWKVVPVMELWELIMRSTYDHAEPGILFIDKMNSENNLWYCEKIEATNPCVTGDTVILTDEGYKRIDSVVNQQVTVWNGFEWSPTIPRVTGQNQEIIDFEFSDGSKLACTPYHKFILTDGSRVEAKDLYAGMKLAKHRFPIIVGDYDVETKIAYTQGFYSGDGQRETNRIWLYEEKCALVPHLAISCYSDQTTDRNQRLMASMNFQPQAKDFVPDTQYSIKTRLDWLAGLIDADGVLVDGCAVQIWSVNRDFLQKVKYLLNTVGATGTISLGRKAGVRSLPNGNGGWNDYNCQECWRISIPASSMIELFDIGLTTHRVTINKIPNREATRFITVTFKHKREYLEPFVYCFTEERNHSGIFNGIMTAQCAEQPLPPYGCCDLGSINLTKFVREPFNKEGMAWFDYKAFEEAIKISVRMLDNVLDATIWPLEKQQQEAMNKRRIGLGFLGIGDAILMLGKSYHKEDGVEFASMVSEVMRNAAYNASIDLAIEKGPFPLFNATKYLKGEFISRLPESIKKRIRKYGIRNSHLLSIAPTGTIVLAFADNASNGIEPPFSWVYDRKKRQDDGSMKSYEVADHAWRLYRAMGHDMTKLPDNFVTALQMTVDAHVNIMKAVQPFIDTSISKTVNIPADYPYEDFKDLYMMAWKAGLKGLATYRPNSVMDSILSVKEDKPISVAPVVVENTVTTDDDKTFDQILDEMYSEQFISREDGRLSGSTIKGRFYTNQGEQKFLITINFMKVIRETKFGKVTIRRPIEFLLESNFTGSGSSAWAAITRMMSLLGRSGMPLNKVIENLREITWEHGNVRYGTRMKDNKSIPYWHASDAAAIGYIIEEELKYQGFLTEDGALARSYTLETNGEIIVNAPVVESDSNEVEIIVETITPEVQPKYMGKKCTECGLNAVQKRDGCEICTHCGAIGSCG